MNDFVVVMEKEYIGYPLYKSKGCNIIQPYVFLHKNKIQRKIKKAIEKLIGVQLIGINKQLIGASKTFLMYDGTDPEIVGYIRKNNPDARIIVYYINPVKYSFPVDSFRKYDAELWTFDDEDAIKYNMQWNPLHYFATEVKQDYPKTIDIAFVGADKGRYNTLIELKQKFIDLGLSVDMHITANTNTPFYDRKKYKRRLSYQENMEHVYPSRAVLDIMQKDQYGYTMRIPETMVNHIKLITNNPNIIQYPFYCQNNIFILGVDDLDELNEFIYKPWDSIHDEVIKDLEYEYWIQKFCI